MKSFYSLIKVHPNSSTEDSIVLGLIISDSQSVRFKYSSLKKRILNSLMRENTKMLEFILKEIESSITKENENKELGRTALFESSTKLSVDYFEYLSKYSNGVLKFTSPKLIDDTITDDRFSQLFYLLVGDTFEIKNDKKIEKEARFYKRVDKNLINRVKGKVHTNIELDSTFAPTLLSSFKLDCIGKNGSLVGAKTLPLTKTIQTLHKDLNTYISVIAHLRELDGIKHKENQFFLISDEPEVKSSDEYKVYKHLKDSEHLFSLINSQESERVAEIIEKKNAQTFLTI